MATWTTNDLPERDQFSYWREVLCEAYIALNPVREPAPGGFAGHVTAHPLSTINVTTISSGRQKIYRGRSEISRMPTEVYFLNLQLRGQCCMQQGGRAALLNPGEFSIVDSTEPYLNDYCSDDWEQYSFRIPRHLLRPLLRNPEKATATIVADNGGISTVAIDLLKSIVRNVEGLSPTGATLSSSMVELVAMSLGATQAAQEMAPGSARQALCASLVSHIETNVADPELAPAKVAAHFGISVRYLHKVLEEGGRSFGRLVLEQRLERCARDFVKQTADSETVTEIALRWGFNDLSHFSRTFRQRFGKTPREYRSEGA
ncbi:helix-turn-helix domain-containing protein [Bradyrhizobium iriomotense]|uniref:helix-turn-helix domain-containing protein n=1 Tax=Bradyrhizobium iriomotense TaxID=441950 RepID=UPI001B8A01B5|nr:helix-turn-helix domain-containing protein [Bradyrhizobium iriomotense]MBR0780279.1 helix-turn-helix domain-containing protein [Bradyrhizobium iriomotense]